MTQQFALRNILERNEDICLHKDIYVNVNSILIMASVWKDYIPIDWCRLTNMFSPKNAILFIQK